MWAWFWRLNSKRTAGQYTVNPLTFSELHAFSEVYRLHLRPWEVSALGGMDDAYVEAVSSKADAVTGDPAENAKALRDSMMALAKKPKAKK